MRHIICIAPDDYTSMARLLNIPALTTSYTVPFTIPNEIIFEVTENFTAVLTLPSPSNRLSLGTNIMATVDIEETEGKQLCI